MVKVKCPFCRKYFWFDESEEICICPKCGGRVSLAPKLRQQIERENERDWIDEINDLDTFLED